jgi:hypothetical protein
MRRLLLIATAACCGLTVCRTSPGPISSRDETRFFLEEVKPLLQQNCLRCHNGTVPPPRLDLSTRSAALAGRTAKGRFIVPGDPDRSLLITAVSRPGNHPRMMPQLDLSLTDVDLATLREWIAAGAAWPEGPIGHLHHVADAELPR